MSKRRVDKAERAHISRRWAWARAKSMPTLPDVTVKVT